MISKTLGIEGKKLLTPEDDYAALKEFNHAYEGTKTAIEEMHLEYQALIQDHPELRRPLERACPARSSADESVPPREPVAFSSATRCPRSTRRPASSPRQRAQHAGISTTWTSDTIIEEPGEIIESLRCKPNTPRHCITEEKMLKDIRASVLKHIKDTYLKRVDAPVGVKPALKCWMEINEG